ncbi:MAG: vWA domain-containing protein [Candidatus Thorarchaeota archaeon]
MKLRAKRGRNQQGFCFVAADALDSSTSAYELRCDSNSIYSDIRGSAKVPEGVIIIDARVYDMLFCNDEDEINLDALPDEIPTCTEIHLDIVSKRNLQNHTVAHAISERIDDFQEHFEGLILQVNQEFVISDLGVSFVVRSLSPTDRSTNAARISWKNLLKIHLGALEAQPNNLCLIVEVAAATQIADVRIGADVMTRHQAILHTLNVLKEKFRGYGSDIHFSGMVYSDEVLPFITFNPQTGEETEITLLHSSSLIEAFRKWLDSALDEFTIRPSNPGEALKHGLEKAQSLSESNGLPTTIVFFSSGVHSAGQNPVKITRMNMGEKALKILSISVGEDSAKDIMEAIAEEGKGIAYHLDTDNMMNQIVDAINRMTTSLG